MFLRQSTAQVILFGPCLDKGDGVTEEVSLTLAQADMRISKDGAAFGQKGTAGNATHDSDGWYNTTLSTTDTNTVGELVFNVHQPANMLPVWERYWVLEETVYDAIFGASAAAFGSDNKALISTDAQDLSASLDVNTKLIEGADATDQITAATDASLDTAISELGVAAPTATPTVRTGLMLLYMALRNKLTVTSSAMTISDTGGTTIASKSLSDNGTTYQEDELA